MEVPIKYELEAQRFFQLYDSVPAPMLFEYVLQVLKERDAVIELAKAFGAPVA